jgi:DNA-binding cell septation regulator SpoVG
MRVEIVHVIPQEDRSLRAIVNVRLPDIGLEIDSIGVHRGKDGRFFVTMPSRPRQRKDGSKWRQSLIRFLRDSEWEFEDSVIEAVNQRDRTILAGRDDHKEGSTNGNTYQEARQ